MSFAEQLQVAKSHLTAREVASAVSTLLSVRTVEDWLADRRSPPPWTHEWILSRVRSPKKARSRKGPNIYPTKSRCTCTANPTQANKSAESGNVGNEWRVRGGRGIKLGGMRGLLRR